MTEGSSLDEHEFATWIPAAQALKWLAEQRRDYSGAQAAIIRRAADSLIRGAAETLKAADGRTQYSRTIIPAFWWNEQIHSYAGSGLWKLEGDTEFEYTTNLNSMYAKKYKYRAYGVRFEPVDILAPLAPQPQQAPVSAPPARSRSAPATRALPPKVTIKELRAWYVAQFAENPGLTFPQVEALAAAHFRPRRVTRQPLRDVISELQHTAKRGNPAFSRK